MPVLPAAHPLLPSSTAIGLKSRSHIVWIPLILAVLASALLMTGNGDQWLADQLYRWQGGQWALKDAWWTSQLIHKGGRNLTWAAALLVMFALLRSRLDSRWRPLGRPLLYLLLAVGLSTGLIALLKTWTHMDCPWDLQRYGGLRPFIGLFQTRPLLLGHAACFPAGHAGSGYAWMALFFFMREVRPQWRWPALLIALALGAVFGVAQQLRGAHFLSHDLWSLAISWTLASTLSLWMLDSASTAAATRAPVVALEKAA